MICIGLFSITSIGLMPFRIVDTYRTPPLRPLLNVQVAERSITQVCARYGTISGRQRSSGARQGFPSFTTRTICPTPSTTRITCPCLQRKSRSTCIIVSPPLVDCTWDGTDEWGDCRAAQVHAEPDVVSAARDADSPSVPDRVRCWYMVPCVAGADIRRCSDALWITIMNDLNSFFQCLLSGCMWGLNR